MKLEEAISEIRYRLNQKGILNAIDDTYNLDAAIKMVYEGMCGEMDVDLFVNVTGELYLDNLLDKPMKEC